MNRDTPRFADLPLPPIHRVRKDGERVSACDGGWFVFPP